MTGRWTGTALLAVLGCSSVTGPSTPNVIVTAALLTMEENQVVRVTIENQDGETILVRCGAFTLEGLTIEGWAPARIQTCPDNPPWVEIAPNTSESAEFDAPAGGPQFRGAVRFRMADETEQWVGYSEPTSW